MISVLSTDVIFSEDTILSDKMVLSFSKTFSYESRFFRNVLEVFQHDCVLFFLFCLILPSELYCGKD